MDNDLKELLVTVYNICDSFDRSPDYNVVKKSNPNLNLRDIVNYDLCNFAMYLTASDGEVKWQEADYISELRQSFMTSREIIDYINEKNIYSTGFEEELPTSFKVFIIIDVLRELKGEREEGQDVFFKMLLDIYELVGKDILSCDMDVTPEEKRDFSIYLNNLRDNSFKYLQSLKDNLESDSACDGGTVFTGGKR